MGVRGLTTFIANRSSQYLDRCELQDCYVVLDGNSIGAQLYKWHCKCNDCFGGDYDKYASLIYSFFKLLSDCKITPLVVLDGAYEKRKMKTVYSRIRNKISAARDLNSVTESRVSLFPLFLREIFVDVLLKLKIKSVRCQFEGDGEAAHLARSLQCPLISYDSDFYIFDVIYIPFPTVDLKIRKNKNGNYILCEVYRVDKFLNSFGGLDKINLPLLAVLLGNDYIKKSAFSRFYRQLKMHKTKGNEQQTQIKSVIVWLKDETPESALRKILGRYKLQNRKRLTKKIEKAIEAYQNEDSEICTYFNISQTDDVPHTHISVPKPEDIDDIDEEDLENDAEDSSEDTPDDEETNTEAQVTVKYNIPNFFLENFKKCLYPPCFMDMIVSNTYFCLVQIEDFYSEHSHVISLDILAAIHKILTFPKRRRLTYVARNEHSHVKRNLLPLYDKTDLPQLTDIENMDAESSKSTLFNVLNIQDNIFHMFPNSWHLFLISIKYWVSNSKSKVELPYVYSTVLCGIILKYVDTKIGFHRSSKSFFSKFATTNSSAVSKSVDSTKNITETLDAIDSPNSIACMKKLIHYFQMDEKMKCYVKLFERKVVHEFAQFQSCLLHIKYLNSLLNFPFPLIDASEFYDGTFVYNMTNNLLKRTDLKSYIKILLEDCPIILHVFELMMEQIEVHIVSDLGKHEPPRKRKKKKKKPTKEFVPEIEHTGQESEEEYDLDSNNKFSLLSFINK